MAQAQVGFSISIFKDAYERSFEAEIDELTGSEILVRGRLYDHRFDFELTWRLRTPEYEVLEASTEQKAGEESHFSPEICRRYPRIRACGSDAGFQNEF